MHNRISIILSILTLISGYLWFINKITSNICKKKINERNINSIYLQSKTKKIKSLLISFFPTFFIVLMIRSFLFEPFYVPSSSMMPTLLIGDFILVKKFAYNIKDPLFNKTLMNVQHPNRGDLIVFKYPGNNNINYVKRVIGVPGDIVSYNSLTKKISIYNIKDQTKKIINVSYIPIKLNSFVQILNKDKIIKQKINIHKHKNKPLMKILTYNTIQETIESTKYNILLLNQYNNDMDYQKKQQLIHTWLVPTENYFVMGDNRDNSFDSRYWGFVPEENLIGKVTTIWMSWNTEGSKWPIGIHFNRIKNL